MCFILKKELTSATQRRKTLENQLKAKRKTLESMQKEAPNIEGESNRIRLKIVNINQERARLAVEYKDFVWVSITLTMVF